MTSSKEIDRAYVRAYRQVPVDTPDAWGDLTSFLDAAAQTQTAEPGWPRRLEAMSRHLEVPIRDESIRLGQLLKLAGVVQDGAMARMVIENGEVTVDGETVMRRGIQVRPGAVVSYAGESILVTSSPE